jgi:uncharacterized RDD family membrane protein YckC
MNNWNAPPWNGPPPYGLAMMQDEMLTRGVLTRRCLGWFVDLALIAGIATVLWMVLFGFGVMTLGLGMPLLGLLPLVPFCYHFLFLAGMGATPGQALFGLRVARNDDLGPPSPLQAVVSTLIYYLTLATSGLLLLVALVTARHRTLHDMISGLVVVRARALTAPVGSWNMPGGSPHA